LDYAGFKGFEQQKKLRLKKKDILTDEEETYYQYNM
jgi:hypothetical protein